MAARKKIVLVLPPYDYDGSTYVTLRSVLEGRGHRITVTSMSANSASSDDGRTTQVDVRIKNLKYYDYDAFVFVGGEGARSEFEDPQFRKLVGEAKYKPIAATGMATVALALHQGLSKKRATGPTEFAELMIQQGVEFTNAPFEVHDKIFTLKDPSAAEQFAIALAESIEK